MSFLSQETWMIVSRRIFILFSGWWTNEIKFHRENFKCYAQDSSCSFEHYTSKLSQRKPILTGLYHPLEFSVDLDCGVILEKDCLERLNVSRLKNGSCAKNLSYCQAFPSNQPQIWTAITKPINSTCFMWFRLQWTSLTSCKFLKVSCRPAISPGT